MGPGAIWVASVPLQFNSTIRMNYRKFHKIIGRLFAFSSFVSMIGFVAIHLKKLTTVNYLDGVEPVMLPVLNISRVAAGEFTIAVWFLYTISQSVQFARKKDFQ